MRWLSYRAAVFRASARRPVSKVDGAGTVRRMDLAYPPEAEEFRCEIAGWLKDNLPKGWGDPGFSLTPGERRGPSTTSGRPSSTAVGGYVASRPSTAARA